LLVTFTSFLAIRSFSRFFNFLLYILFITSYWIAAAIINRANLTALDAIQATLYRKRRSLYPETGLALFTRVGKFNFSQFDQFDIYRESFSLGFYQFCNLDHHCILHMFLLVLGYVVIILQTNH